MTPPDTTTKKTHWKIESRDLSHAARINHFWFPLYSLHSLEDAKNSLNIEKRDSHSLSEEFRIVRVETSIKEFVETVWRGLKIAYIIATMKFILAEEQAKKPSLKDVETNQFFVNSLGSLCQKINSTSYSVIALSNGEPHSCYFSEQSINTVIEKVLPKVLKIEF